MRRRRASGNLALSGHFSWLFCARAHHFNPFRKGAVINKRNRARGEPGDRRQGANRERGRQGCRLEISSRGSRGRRVLAVAAVVAVVRLLEMMKVVLVPTAHPPPPQHRLQHRPLLLPLLLYTESAQQTTRLEPMEVRKQIHRHRLC